MKKIVTILTAAIGLLALMGAPLMAQDWPQKQTIRMIVPFPPEAAPMSSPELSQSIYRNDCVKQSSLRTAAERTARSAYKH